MSNIQSTLDTAMEIDGAIGVALADADSGMCLGMAGGRPGFDLEIAAAGNSEVIRSKQKVMASLDVDDSITDILITLGKEYHLMFLRPDSSLFVYICLSRKANLALARHKLTDLVKGLAV